MLAMALVAASAKLARFLFTDKAGRVATMGVWVGTGEADPEAGGVAALRTAMRACSEAAIKQTQLLSYAIEADPGDPIEDEFDRPTDKLKLVGITAKGVEVQVQFPSVLAAGYGADGVTPLETGAFGALLTAFQDNCTSADGEAITGIKSARRMVPQGLKTWTKK